MMDPDELYLTGLISNRMRGNAARTIRSLGYTIELLLDHVSPREMSGVLVDLDRLRVHARAKRAELKVVASHG